MVQRKIFYGLHSLLFYIIPSFTEHDYTGITQKNTRLFSEEGRVQIWYGVS